MREKKRNPTGRRSGSKESLYSSGENRKRLSCIQPTNSQPEKQDVATTQAEKLKNAREQAKYKLLKVETANTAMSRAEKQPVPKTLFSEYWVEGEMCFLFSDTGIGKTILGVQIGDSISMGKPIPGFKIEAEAQAVLYLDFELSDKKFQNRYSVDYKNNYQFSEQFFRVQVDREKDIPDDFERSLQADIETAIKEKGCQVLIVDNITWVKTETEKASDALPLMKYLKTLQRTYDLSILLLAHTPKIAESRPISVNDMAGSKHLMNFVDSAFALGWSHKNERQRYLKQVKVRDCEAVYGTNNVATLQITKNNNFTEFELVGFSHEYDHLKPLKEVEKEIRNQKIYELKRAEPAISNADIARQVGSNRMYVKRVLDSFEPETDGVLI